MSIIKELIDKIPPEIKNMVDREFRVSDLLYDFQERHGYSEKDMSKILGISRKKYRVWISGSQDFKLSELSKIETICLDVFGQLTLEALKDWKTESCQSQSVENQYQDGQDSNIEN